MNEQELQQLRNDGEPDAADHIELLQAQLAHVRRLICSGAEEGFNCNVGNWAEQLFYSNQQTSRLLYR